MLHNLHFLSGRQLSEQGGVFNFHRELVLAQLRQFSAGQRLGCVNAQSPADRDGDITVISGQHPHPYMELAQLLDRPGGALLGCVEKCQISQQGEVMLVRL